MLVGTVGEVVVEGRQLQLGGLRRQRERAVVEVNHGVEQRTVEQLGVNISDGVLSFSILLQQFGGGAVPAGTCDPRGPGNPAQRVHVLALGHGVRAT